VLRETASEVIVAGRWPCRRWSRPVASGVSPDALADALVVVGYEGGAFEGDPAKSGYLAECGAVLWAGYEVADFV
jgi:hypothetical protein